MTTTRTAPDIVCDGCANAIRNALGRLDGVSAIEVDVATKRVSVDHNDRVSASAIEEALDKAGFAVEA